MLIQAHNKFKVIIISDSLKIMTINYNAIL
jgi:hypothetical protein